MMKSIVLDGDKIDEAIKNTRDKMLQGGYDNDDLIVRGDALKAIRKRCISEHLPFKSNTPAGERVLDALIAVHQVKPYRDAYCGWISVKDRLPKPRTEVLAFRKGIIYIVWYDKGIGEWRSDEWGCFNDVTHWMPLPKPPEVNTNAN